MFGLMWGWHHGRGTMPYTAWMARNKRLDIQPKGMEDNRRIWSIKSTKQSSHELKKTERARLGPSRVCTKSSVYTLLQSASWFCGSPNNGCGYICVSFAALEIVFFLLHCLAQLWYEGAALSYCILICPVWPTSPGVLLFSEDFGEIGRVDRGNCGWDILYFIMHDSLFQILNSLSQRNLVNYMWLDVSLDS